MAMFSAMNDGLFKNMQKIAELINAKTATVS